MANNKAKKVKEILSRLDMFETNLVKMQAALESMKVEIQEQKNLILPKLHQKRNNKCQKDRYIK